MSPWRGPEGQARTDLILLVNLTAANLAYYGPRAIIPTLRRRKIFVQSAVTSASRQTRPTEHASACRGQATPSPTSSRWPMGAVTWPWPRGHSWNIVSTAAPPSNVDWLRYPFQRYCGRQRIGTCCFSSPRLRLYPLASKCARVGGQPSLSSLPT
jgi:hypothetical protein